MCGVGMVCAVCCLTCLTFGCFSDLDISCEVVFSGATFTSPTGSGLGHLPTSPNIVPIIIWKHNGTPFIPTYAPFGMFGYFGYGSRFFGSSVWGCTADEGDGPLEKPGDGSLPIWIKKRGENRF